MMVNYLINAESVQESNVFLRKLWSELNDIRPIGWQMFPHKANNKVTIGISNFGEVSFDYVRKGCIKNIIIDNTHDEDAVILKAIQNAQKNSLKDYCISLELRSDKKISVQETNTPLCRVFSNNGNIFIHFGFKAYSFWDIDRVIPSKFMPIESVLYEYTNRLFHVEQVKVAEGKFEGETTKTISYDYDWIDLEDCPKNSDDQVVLPTDFFELISYIVDDDRFDENVELLLNSSNLLMTTADIVRELEFPNYSVKSDIINSMVCSTMEPLSLLLNDNHERCPTCNNMIFSVNRKIKELCTYYFGKEFARYVSNVIYSKRSVFFHKGQPETTQRPNSIFCPQISSSTGGVMMPYGLVNYTLFSYSSFLFRNIARDYFGGNIDSVREVVKNSAEST